MKLSFKEFMRNYFRRRLEAEELQYELTQIFEIKPKKSGLFFEITRPGEPNAFKRAGVKPTIVQEATGSPPPMPKEK